MQIQKKQQLNQQELNDSVKLHYEILNESFLNNFGKEFLKISYKTIVESENNICLFLTNGEEVVGILIATKDGDRFNEEVIRKNFFLMILQIIISSLKNPLLLIKLIQWRLKPSHKNKIKPELQFFAIDKKFQGQGWGKKLIKKF